MDADVPRMPEKQVLIAKGDEYVDEDIKKINELIRARKARAGTVVSYGPVILMDLGPGWEDLGNSVIGGRPVWRVYRHENPRCTLRVPFRSGNHHKDDSAFLRNLVTTTNGKVPKSEWDKIAVFGEAGNPRFFTIGSVEVAEIGGKKAIIMTGQDTMEDQARGKHVYVSLSGDWKDSYELIFGGLADKETFEKQVAMFDKALKTVMWKKE